MKEEVKQKCCIKRSGERVPFDSKKILIAIGKANKEEVETNKRLKESEINEIVLNITKKIEKMSRDIGVEEIQDMVEEELMNTNHTIAKLYITYRYQHLMDREQEGLYKKVLGIVDGVNEDVKTENSNKDTKVLNVQRDYIAGETTRECSKKFFMTKEVMEANEKGIIHFHDIDFSPLMRIHNCCLLNIDDMLQNGTVINGIKIEKPHRFLTAMTITTQIILGVSNMQYGGQTVTLTHLAPFVRDTYNLEYNRLKKLYCDELLNKYSNEWKEKFKGNEELFDEFLNIQAEDIAKREAEELTRNEVKAGVQTFNYQLNSMTGGGGQSPFITAFLYLNETQEYKKELAMIIEEVLKQRIQGMKDRNGIWITQAFPKLIYVLDEDNITEDSEYWYLTKLSAECSAKRMVPDYISAKVMKELKGDVYPCMGCVDGKSVIDYKIDNVRYVESFERAWNRLSENNEVKLQPNGEDLYIDTNNVEIYDCKEKKYVKQYRIIKNTQESWCKVKLSGGRKVDVTNDHPFEVENKGVVLAKDLCVGDKIIRDTAEIKINGKFDLKSWLYGVMVCDSGYCDQVNISLGLDEKDILDKCVEALKEEGQETFVKEWHRGKKGNYYELKVKKYSAFRHKLIDYFGGMRKIERHIPQEIFNSDIDKKCSFMAGLIDADGYINNKGNSVRVQIGSTNRELALQELLLAKEIGLNACLYENHYKGSKNNSVRYLIEFNAIKELKEYIISNKKKEKFIDEHKFLDGVLKENNICEVQSVEEYVEEKYSYDVTTESEHFMFDGIYSHNCRSFLTPDRFTDNGIGNIANAQNYQVGKHKYYGRFNQGVVTINLVDVACSSKKDEEKFWKIFEERLELCHRALQIRHNRLKGTKSDVAPLLWQYGVLARLKSGETIDKLLYNGYSTISLGYAGLSECVKYMKDCSHTTTEGKKFALKVMQKMNDKCAEWKQAENIDYSVYGTPIESTTYKFAKCLQKRFGIIEGVTDKNYITNSYHVNVAEKISAFDKLTKEAEFQKLSPGGAISYVECPDLSNNLEVVLQVMKHIYNTILYAELNCKLDVCEQCGFQGAIPLVKDETGKLIFECPQCGNRDENTIHTARRTCGYIGTQGWNQGRLGEFEDRIEHFCL